MHDDDVEPTRAVHDLLGFDPSKVIPESNFVAPDLIGTVEGWRTWQVAAEPPPFGNTPKLYSVSERDYFWAPRQMSLAHCPRGSSRSPHETPGENCSCGFYSAKTLEHLLSMSYHRYDVDHGKIAVIGRLANWGKVIEGTQGWRAQKAYPVELYVPFEGWRLAKALEEGYGVPVKLMNALPKPKFNDDDKE